MPVLPAKAIIDKFGGQTALAEAIGKPQSTVQYWSRTGLIPMRWHQAIITAGAERNLAIAPTEFLQTDQVLAAAVKLPVAKWPGELEVGHLSVPVYVLDDGRRVLSRTGALNCLTEGKGGGNIESYLEIEVLKPFLPKDLFEQWVEFDIPQVVNKSVKGMTASAFIDVCRAYSRARDTGALTTESQTAIALRASMLLGAFAKEGIEAAIDEVTGYQYERAPDALQTKLRLFLAEEMRPWEKTFPDELWIQFGRLTKWGGPIHSRPKYWGKLVNELVYGYLDSDVLDWLKRNAPAPRTGQNYHQWMSGQFGLKRLIEHIWMLIGMASACRDMPELRQRMAEKYGREKVQLTLYLEPPKSRGD
jgi:P63C domain